jgi:hypothetical protein
MAWHYVAIVSHQRRQQLEQAVAQLGDGLGQQVVHVIRVLQFTAAHELRPNPTQGL